MSDGTDSEGSHVSHHSAGHCDSDRENSVHSTSHSVPGPSSMEAGLGADALQSVVLYVLLHHTCMHI